MGRVFKDLIVQEADGKPRLTFRSRAGTAVLEDVSVEVASTVLQEGDKWGALAANRLLELDDDGAPQAIAPEFTPAAKPSALVSRERMSAAFAKIAAAVTALTGHLADSVRHITAAERAAWNGKAAASHTHDDRYYTETETNNLLAGKAASSHTHDSRYYTEAEVNAKLDGKADTSGTYTGLTAGNSQKIGGKTLSMTLSGDTLRIEWR